MPQLFRCEFKNDGNVKVSYISGSLGSGLAIRDGEMPKHFMLAGADKIFCSATAKIEGKQIWLHAKQVAQPVAARYGFTNEAITNLETGKTCGLHLEQINGKLALN